MLQKSKQKTKSKWSDLVPCSNRATTRNNVPGIRPRHFSPVNDACVGRVDGFHSLSKWQKKNKIKHNTAAVPPPTWEKWALPDGHNMQSDARARKALSTIRLYHANRSHKSDVEQQKRPKHIRKLMLICATYWRSPPGLQNDHAAYNSHMPASGLSRGYQPSNLLCRFCDRDTHLQHFLMSQSEPYYAAPSLFWLKCRLPHTFLALPTRMQFFQMCPTAITQCGRVFIRFLLRCPK